MGSKKAKDAGGAMVPEVVQVSAGFLAGMTATAFTLPKDCTFDEWKEGMALLGSLARRTPWAIGDGLNGGEDKFGEEYAQGVHETGYEEQTLMNMKWVARRWGPARRRDESGARWSHHALLAKMEPADQDTWLKKSIDNGWSTVQLRAALKASRTVTFEANDATDWDCQKCGLTLPEIKKLAKEDAQVAD